MAKEKGSPLSMLGHVSAPDKEPSQCCKETDSARDVIQMVTLTFSIKCVDRACVLKLKESKYMSLGKKGKKKGGQNKPGVIKWIQFTRWISALLCRKGCSRSFSAFHILLM